MRVLFVPLPAISHSVPLIALLGRLDSSFEAAFLLPSQHHDAARAAGLQVLDIHHGGVDAELSAYQSFRPDVAVDDCSLTTGEAAARSGMPRVTILRAGSYPGYTPRNPHHRHSLYGGGPRIPNTAGPRASMYVIPAIRSIEPLPEVARQDSRYVYAGPLLLEDDEMERVFGGGEDNRHKRRRQIEDFFTRNRQRRVVLVTFGTIATCDDEMQDCLRTLLSRGIALVTTFPIRDVPPMLEPLHFHAPILPLDLVCGRVDLVAHQCGSGMYHYPLRHAVPAVTMGTGRFDRDDVGMHLGELGLSTHVAAPADEPGFRERFLAAIDNRLDQKRRGDYISRVGPFQREIQEAIAGFQFRDVLRQAFAEAPLPCAQSYIPQPRAEGAQPAFYARV
jgi:UDP:flavonoid glycosyltransferase YjiC (YdhE family)